MARRNLESDETPPPVGTPPSPLIEAVCTIGTRIGNTVRRIANSPRRPLEIIRTSPSNQSQAASALTPNQASVNTASDGDGDEEADAQALVDFYYTEKGNGGDSDEEGEECELRSVAAVTHANSS